MIVYLMGVQQGEEAQEQEYRVQMNGVVLV